MRPLYFALVATLFLPAVAQKPKAAKHPDPASAPLRPRERALQLLNRFTYGPRPGDLDRVLAQTPEAWLTQQLNPVAIADPVLDRRLNDYPTLRLPADQILALFPDRGNLQQVADGKADPPLDPLLASVYQVQLYKLNAEQVARKIPPATPLTPEEIEAKKRQDQATASRIAGELFALPKKDRMAALNAMPIPDRIAFAGNVPGDQRNILSADFTPRERETLAAMQGGVGASYRIVDELVQATLLRDILSERQLQAVMTDFWFNHFNIFAPKDSDQWYTTVYERDAIRAHALGHFRDLLLATAQSPAMMVYLDNWQSIGPNSVANGVNPANPKSKPGKRGLNENYGREVMELHTLGVNGGYTQADVTALAAILTGWSVDKPNEAGPFRFDFSKHEPGPKTWLGYTIDDHGHVAGNAPQPSIPANIPDGMRQGYAALILLAASPKTAHFISYQLAQRFLADDPPPAVVDRLAATYLATDGDIAALLRTLIESPEFNSRRFFRTKVKLPSEFLASAFRATATDPQNPGALANALANQFGQPLFKALPPTGYYVTADHWMNTQSLLGRLNFADQLTHNHFANQKFDAPRVLALSLMNDQTATPVSFTQGPDVALKVLESTLIGAELSPKTDAFIHTQLAQQPASNPQETLNLLTALLLGSPEFQLR